jgi:mannose-6-phosphate isomerase-like protein (cupin superfamily)
VPKRIVTSIGEDGRSRVLRSAGDPVPFTWGEVAWPARPDDPNRTALAPGEVSWRLYTLPSSEELDAYVAKAYGHAGDGRAGMHTTPTIDFVYVLEGRVALVLDEETVELGPGDCVVQQATAHAWRVLEGPVRLSTLMIGT